MTRLRSLKSRLCFGFIPLLIVLVTLVTVIAHWEMEEILYGHIDHILLAKCHGIQVIMNAVADSDEQRLRIDSLLQGSGDMEKTLYIVWDVNNLKPVATNIEADEKLTPDGDSWDDYALNTPGIYHGWNSEYRLIKQSYTAGADTFHMLVAYPCDSLHDQLHFFLWFLLGVGTVMTFIAIALVLGSVHWALRPVNRAAEMLKGISTVALGQTDIQRLDVPRELEAFTAALSNMLTRLDLYVDKQKQFTANAAHELRTPITLAKSSMQTAFYRLNDPVRNQMALTEAITDLDRMASLIDQLQMLSSLDDAEQVFDVESIPLSELVDGIVRSYEQTDRGHIRIENGPPLVVSGNRELLQCLLVNLLDNAIKYGPPARPVRVRVYAMLKRSSAGIDVCDEGGGISDEDLARLTERFYRVDGSRSRHTGGRGLGLSIASEIAKKHGGHLTILSAPEEGTRVTVELPLSQTD